MPLLFGLDPSKKYNVVFELEDGRWVIHFEERQDKVKAATKKRR
jgi:hypothetical protein